MGRCVLCAGCLESWDSQLFAWRGFSYRYLRCQGCKSLVCDPMPSDQLLAELYGAGYASAFPDSYQIESPRNREWVCAHLASRPPGTFVDYGCGDGSLLAEAVGAGWNAYGVELDPYVAERATAATGCRVLCSGKLGADTERGDVVHIGDVLEHLPDPAAGLAQALNLLVPGGTLLAQGPLEAGPSFFSSIVRPGRRRRDHAVEIAPYHLVQATAHGQRRFFRRAGLFEHSYDVFEVDWPAPSRLAVSDLTNPRALGLCALRRVSRASSRLASAMSSEAKRGNRFQYVGSVFPKDRRGKTI
jgi:SAM-dependent methyltransferase